MNTNFNTQITINPENLTEEELIECVYNHFELPFTKKNY